MLSKSVNNGPCIIFYDTRASTPTYQIKTKQYKYINIKPSQKNIKNVKDLGLTDEIHVNNEVVEDKYEDNILDEIKI